MFGQAQGQFSCNQANITLYLLVTFWDMHGPRLPLSECSDEPIGSSWSSTSQHWGLSIYCGQILLLRVWSSPFVLSAHHPSSLILAHPPVVYKIPVAHITKSKQLAQVWPVRDFTLPAPPQTLAIAISVGICVKTFAGTSGRKKLSGRTYEPGSCVGHLAIMGGEPRQGTEKDVLNS